MTQVRPQNFAINHITAAHLSWRDLLRLARETGAAGIELRNTMERPLFDGEAPEDVASVMSGEGLRLLALAEIYAFNTGTRAILDETAALASLARRAGAEAIILIPQIGGDDIAFDQLCEALDRIGRVLASENMRALIEPIGFSASSLRDFGSARRAIHATHGHTRFGLVHDSFHHHLAGGGMVCAELVDLIHISGVRALKPREQMADADRGLVDDSDQLRSAEQLKSLRQQGSKALASMEAFDPKVWQSPALSADLRESFQHILKVLDAAITSPALDDRPAPLGVPV